MNAGRNGYCLDHNRGFTLIELAVTLVLVGIVAVMAFGHWRPGEARVGYQADRLARDLRHVQQLAVAWDRPLRLVPAGGGYTVSCVTASAIAPCNSAPVIDPADGAPFNVTLEDATVAGPVLEFDGLGRPASGGGLLAAPVVYTLTGGGHDVSVTVQPLTGYASVAY